MMDHIKTSVRFPPQYSQIAVKNGTTSAKQIFNDIACV